MGFKLGKKKKLFEGRFIKLWGTEFLDKSGNSHMWEWIDKADVVIILPITAEGNLVLIKIYRVPLERYVIESPAGLHDNPSESREEVAKRELLEETGYEADKLVALPSWPYRSGLSKNMAYGFIATGAKKVNHAGGDDTEDLTVFEISPEKLMDLYFNPPMDATVIPEIIAMYEMARFLKII